jgi:RNA polymerase sigma-70 factor (ECF subfamily)
MAQTEDRDLVARVLAGEREAFRGLVDRYAPRVHRLCFALLRQREDAEDAAQEAFLRAYRALGRFDPTYDFPPWLLTIATNLCRDRLRRRRHEAAGLDADRMEECAVLVERPTEPSRDRARLLAGIDRALGRLNADHRAAFLLYHRERMSYAEIAAVLGRPVGTVRAHLHRARRRLGDLLQSEQPSEGEHARRV